MVHDYNSKNYRFACPKTSGKLDYEKCSMRVKSDRITLDLHKRNKADYWDELFKVRLIGEPKYDSDDD